MNKEMKWALIGIIVGIAFIAGAVSEHDLDDSKNIAICEAELPRHMNCKLVAVVDE